MKISDIKTPFHLLSDEEAISLVLQIREKRRRIAQVAPKEKKPKAASMPRAKKQSKPLQPSVAQLELLMNEIKEKMR